ncbi:MAG: DUF1269 domain-containing protein [Flavobacteriales bacterium]|nr:DUF1269 domain-containing protein [Flavobacteriales bacterium]
MSKLLAISYDSMSKAEECLKRMQNLEHQYYADIKDAVIAEVKEDQKVKLHQTNNLTVTSAISGGFWGSFIGLLLTGPLGMLIIGGVTASLSALSARWTDYGISDPFMKDLSSHLKPGRAVVFVLLEDVTFDKLVAEIKPLKGDILHSSFSDKQIEALQMEYSEQH